MGDADDRGKEGDNSGEMHGEDIFSRPDTQEWDQILELMAL